MRRTHLPGSRHWRELITFVLAQYVLGGCASSVLESRRFKSYDIGAERSASIGAAFFVNQDGEVRRVKHWVGVLNSPDGWRITDIYSEDFVRQELLYSGRSGDTIKIAYKEFRRNLAAPAFFQNLEYDLAKSKIIRFQRFTIEVIEATNEFIRYRVVSDTAQ